LLRARRLSHQALALREVQIRLKALCSRRILVTLESVETSSQREISLASSSGPNTSASSVKREFFCRDSRSPPLSTNSQTPSIRTRVSYQVFLRNLYYSFFLNSTILIINISIASQLLKLLAKYKPESHKEKRTRLQGEAEAKKGGAEAKKTAKPVVLKFGLNHVTELVESGKAKLVVMAHDVDPIELLVFLPALCRKKGIPYAFIKGKARLGKLVHQKTATCIALTEVRKEDYQDLELLSKNFRSQFNDNEALRRNWGGGVMGIKNQHMMAQREKQREIELAKKANM
jgi:large subunit ribosomal protein L7Ae